MVDVAVKIYDSPDVSNNPVADLKNADDVSYTLTLNEAGKASFSIPADDPHVDDFDLLDYAEIYDGDERVGLYRINEEVPQRDQNNNRIEYRCKHVLDTLNDGRIVDKVTKSGVSTALSYILSEQNTSHWQLGTVDFSKTFTYEFQEQSLLNALLSVPQVWWDDYQFTFDTTSYPWTLNLVKPDITPTATLYYNKNIQVIEKEVSIEPLITQLYALGEGSGDDRIQVGPLESNTGTYGYHTEIWEESRFDNTTDLESAAQKYLNKRDTPRVEFSGQAADFYRIMEDSNNELKLGDYVRVYDPDLSFDLTAQIVELSKTDITGEPANIDFQLDNQRRKIPNFGALAEKDKATEENLASGSVSGGGAGGGGALSSGGVGSDNIADEAVSFSKFDTGLTNDAGEQIKGARMEVSAQTVFDAAYDPQGQWPDDASAPDSAKIQGETLIEGGYIKTVYLEAEFAKIDTLDLTDTTLTVNSVKEGGADETIDHVTTGDYEVLSSTTNAYPLSNNTSVTTDNTSVLESVSIGDTTSSAVTSVSTTTDSEGHVTDVSTNKGLFLDSVALSTTSTGCLTDADLIYDTMQVLGDISQITKDVLVSVSS